MDWNYWSVQFLFTEFSKLGMDLDGLKDQPVDSDGPLGKYYRT